jgi:hypothetical protein
MESVKTALAAALLKEFGPGSVMELDTADLCMKIELPVSRDHVIYVRPDAHERNFLCHYAHKADLEELLCDTNGDTLAWKQRNAAQLPLRVRGVMLRDFVATAMWYARQAAARMVLTKGLGGRRAGLPRVETFAEVRKREYYDPDPTKGAAKAGQEQGTGGGLIKRRK